VARPWAVIALLAAGLGLGRAAQAQLVPLGGQFQVNTYTTSYQGVPAVTGDGAGNFVVVWKSYGSAGSDTSCASIQGQRYDSSGTAVGGQFQVKMGRASCRDSAAVTGDGAGNFVEGWGSDGD